MSVDPDPESVDMGRPQSWSKYYYVIGNPLAYTDPHGEKWFYVGDEWIFFEDADVIEVVTVDENGTSSTMRLQREDSVVFFEVSALTLLNPTDRASPGVLSPAWLMLRVEHSPASSRSATFGPIPEGNYSFSPSAIQELSFVDNLIGTASFGKRGVLAFRAQWHGCGVLVAGRLSVGKLSAPRGMRQRR